MDHAEFVELHRQGRVRVRVDAKLAARYLSGRLMLPVFATPVIGLGIALALWGFIWTGAALMIGGIAFVHFIRRSAPRFLVNQALQDATVFGELLRLGILQAEAADA